MRDFLFKIKMQLKTLPKIYWIHLAVLFVAEVVAIILRPDEPGLYVHIPQVAPIVLTLLFFFARAIRKNFRRTLYTYSIVQFAFLAIDYLTAGHAGLLQLSFTAVPVFIFWVILFAIWNAKQFREGNGKSAAKHGQDADAFREDAPLRAGADQRDVDIGIGGCRRGVGVLRKKTGGLVENHHAGAGGAHAAEKISSVHFHCHESCVLCVKQIKKAIKNHFF